MVKNNKAVVAVLMGSSSDLPVVKDVFETLRKFHVPFAGRVISAHRTPDAAAAFARTAETEGFKVIICAAGMAAHLGGVVAAHTILPVIGIPLASEPFSAMDSLLSVVQMPPGIPVAAVTAGKGGAKNAALLAVSMLAIEDASLAEKLRAFRKEQADKVAAADHALQQELGNA
jgi:5-(carboxyamino)imidazole ribonucleotide mutase